MVMLKLDGWCLPSLHATELPGPASHFFLNTHYLVSARPAVLSGQAGYVLWDDVGEAYFVAVSEAEMGMLFHMAKG